MKQLNILLKDEVDSCQNKLSAFNNANNAQRNTLIKEDSLFNT